MSYDRKAFSAEPQAAAAILGKRWEDLIDAAASATEEDSRDLTPVKTTLPLPRLHTDACSGAWLSQSLSVYAQPDIDAAFCSRPIHLVCGFPAATGTNAPAAGVV